MNGSRRCGTWSLPYTSQVQLILDVLPSWTYLIVSPTFGAESIAKRKLPRQKSHMLFRSFDCKN